MPRARFVKQIEQSPNFSLSWLFDFLFVLQVVLVLSQHYTASQWCMFEAHMSQHRLVQVHHFTSELSQKGNMLKCTHAIVGLS